MRKFYKNLLLGLGITSLGITFVPSFEAPIDVEAKKNSLDVKLIDIQAEGDCVLIKYGDVQILVDTGDDSEIARKAINKALLEEFKGEDKVLDYLIFTHMDADHIGNIYKETAALTSKSDSKYLFNFLSDNKIKIGTLIDSDITMDPSIKASSFAFAPSTLYQNDDGNEKGIYNNYKKARTSWMNNGTTYYPVSVLFKKEKQAAGVLTESAIENYIQSVKYNSSGALINNTIKADKSLSNVFTLASDVKLRILDNPYYYTSPDGTKDEKRQANNVDKNNRSVCFVIEHDSEKWLFTGDLMEFNSGKKTGNTDELHGNYSYIGGETLLVEKNSNVFGSVNEVPEGNGFLFFKAGHHGSDSSNSAALLDMIRPRYVGICAEMIARGLHEDKNSSDYPYDTYGKSLPFPGQFAINNITKWTDKVTITDKRSYLKSDKDPSKKEWKSVPFFGNVTYSYLNGEMTVTSDNDANSKTIKSSEEEKAYYAQSIFTNAWFIENRQIETRIYNLSGKELNANSKNGECTYIKVGSKDILINAGVDVSDNYDHYGESINYLCNDGVLDYVIVTDCSLQSCSEINKKYSAGKLFGLEVANLIMPLYSNPYDTYGKLLEKVNSDKGSMNVIHNAFSKLVILGNEEESIYYALGICEDVDYSLSNPFTILNNEVVGFAAIFTVSLPTFDRASKIRKNSYYYSYLNMGNMNVSTARTRLINRSTDEATSVRQEMVKKLDLFGANTQNNYYKTLQLPADGNNSGNEEMYLLGLINADSYIMNAPAYKTSEGKLLYPSEKIERMYKRNIYSTYVDEKGNGVSINNNLYNRLRVGLNQYIENKARGLIQSNFNISYFGFNQKDIRRLGDSLDDRAQTLFDYKNAN